jgi:hypothetical protein
MSAVIRMHRGVSTLFLDGEPHPGLAYMTLNLKEKYVEQFARAGVQLFSFSTASDYDYYGFTTDGWKAPDRYDTSEFDQRMETILRAAPRAKVFPRVYLCSPPWWDREHPAELLSGPSGVYAPALNFGWLPEGVEEKHRAEKATVPSFSSQVWIDDASHALEQFLAHAEDKYGAHIIGYHLVSGGSQEWYWWGAFEKLFADWSEPHQAAFRRWLHRRGIPGATDARVPTEAERLTSEKGIFRDPRDPAALRVIEYWKFHCEAMLDAMRRFTATTRRLIGSEKLIGVFYGYFVDLCRHVSAWHESGHLALQSVLADPNLDFVCSPTTYKNRRVCTGTSLFNSATESFGLHRKYWWNENDILTLQSPALKDRLFLRPQTAVEARHLQRREFAHSLCRATGMWWFDMWGGYHDDPAAMADIRRMVDIATRSVHLDRGSVAEVAVVLDDESIRYIECSNRLTVPLIADQLIELGHIGAPYDTLHVDDLPLARTYKVYVFLDLFWADDERLRKVREIVERAGVTAVFVYAAGIIGETFSIERTERLTGLKIAMGADAAPLLVRTVADGHIPALDYGSPKSLAPVFHAVDPDAAILGYLLDDSGAATNRAGLVAKQSSRGRVVFSSAPALPAKLLAVLFRDAGVHLYTEHGESVFANQSLLAICKEPGTDLALRLPEPAVLFDLYEERELILPSSIAEISPSGDGTWLFFRGPREEWESRTQVSRR